MSFSLAKPSLAQKRYGSQEAELKHLGIPYTKRSDKTLIVLRRHVDHGQTEKKSQASPTVRLGAYYYVKGGVWQRIGTSLAEEDPSRILPMTAYCSQTRRTAGRSSCAGRPNYATPLNARKRYEKKSPPLLPARAGNAPEYRTVLLQLHQACEAGGVKDATPHDVRAMALTAVQNQRGKAAAKALGDHATEANTERNLRDCEIPIVDGPTLARSA